MNTITITIAATPDNLRKLADAFGTCIDETMLTDAVPAKRYATGAPSETPGTPVVKSAEIKVPENAKSVAKEPETVAKEPKNVAKPEGPQHTMSDLRTKAAELIKKAENKAPFRELLDEFGVPRVPELPEDQWDAFYERLEAIA